MGLKRKVVRDVKTRMVYVALIRGNGQLTTLEVGTLYDINDSSFSREIFMTLCGLEV